MCLAVPGKIIKKDGMKLEVKYPKESRQVLNGGITVKVGDYVMVQMGIVIKKISAKEALVYLKAWGVND